jgi:hypothetical protein
MKDGTAVIAFAEDPDDQKIELIATKLQSKPAIFSEFSIPDRTSPALASQHMPHEKNDPHCAISRPSQEVAAE